MPITFIEHKSSSYAELTKENAKAYVTFAFAFDFETAGEKCTRNAVFYSKGLYVPISLHNNLEIYDFVTISKHINDKVWYGNEVKINIAGNGIYTLSKYNVTQKQIDDIIAKFLYSLVQKMLGKKIIFTCGGQTGVDEAGAKASNRFGLETIVIAPKGWKFRDINGIDICDEVKFKERFL